jgi:AAA family ATP:ADP antiporter
MTKKLTHKPTEFGKWRSFFWPIHNYELKKILPMLGMFFFISFVYSTLRAAKDGLVITAPGASGISLLYLKVFWVIPAALILMIIYAKLSNILSKEKLFYATVLPFLIFFAVFALFLYPNKDYLHSFQFADYLLANLPERFVPFIATIKNWSFSLFYVMAELWGSFVLSLLFWGFANDTTHVSEAKRFYALFGLGANFALYAAGDVLQFINNLNPGPDTDQWQSQLNYLTIIAVLSGLIIMAIYRWINTNVLTDTRFYDPAEQTKVKKEKPKMTLMDSFKFLSKSKYMICIALLVLSYNMIINLIEITWKEQAKILYSTPATYIHFMAYYQKALAVTTVFMMLFVASNVLRRFGWAVAAYITPVVLLITGAGFFTFIVFRDVLDPTLVNLGTTTLFVAVIFGTIQNVMSKASKYSLFDPTKEMAYIPLDQESKVKGKAAIDTVGARLGKAGGSGIQIGLTTTLGVTSLTAVAPHIGVIMLIIIGVWMWAIKTLNDIEFKKIEK